MKTTTTLIAILLLAFFTQAQNFRNTEWGMGIEEVKKTEPETISWEYERNNDYRERVFFYGKLFDYHVRANYIFFNGDLWLGGYSFPSKDYNVLWPIYQNLSKKLHLKYGDNCQVLCYLQHDAENYTYYKELPELNEVKNYILNDVYFHYKLTIKFESGEYISLYLDIDENKVGLTSWLTYHSEDRAKEKERRKNAKTQKETQGL